MLLLWFMFSFWSYLNAFRMVPVTDTKKRRSSECSNAQACSLREGYVKTESRKLPSVTVSFSSVTTRI